ncbi:hypothetical protein CY34DRAFT_100974 [Suillus luteus UH-Slu-Lm8-n1]|uniref:Uncharacterized protein n=1 Tax=Suillus luteus UH-Slu-Lm8-n1 TaxID=930992 RepID=A0A0C9Z5G0_9AGAM|nr:hypothetical protein CY34DRAFT_100974 [Suillus luteus UH-Slu-Lm8-n1]
MSSSIKLGDDFLRVPKLVADGENWMTYKDRLSWSVDARGFLGHLEGTERKPVDPSTLSGRGASWSPTTPDEVKELTEYKAAMKEWRMGEAIMKQQIAGTIPDSLFIQVKNLAMAGEIFAYLSNLFEKCSRVVSIEYCKSCKIRSALRWATSESTLTKCKSSKSNYLPSDMPQQMRALQPSS